MELCRTPSDPQTQALAPVPAQLRFWVVHLLPVDLRVPEVDVFMEEKGNGAATVHGEEGEVYKPGISCTSLVDPFLIVHKANYLWYKSHLEDNTVSSRRNFY